MVALTSVNRHSRAYEVRKLGEKMQRVAVDPKLVAEAREALRHAELSQSELIQLLYQAAKNHERVELD